MLRRLTIVDYVGNLGGGIRFTHELLTALRARRPELAVTLVSHGPALERYRAAVGELCALRDLAPRVPARKRAAKLLPEGRYRAHLAGVEWDIVVPRRALRRGEVTWFPWGHRHVLPGDGRRVLCSLHDFILFELPGLLPELLIAREREVLMRWLESRARLVVTADTTTQLAAKHFGADPSRLAVVPLSADHVALRPEPLPAEWRWASQPYVLLPANTFPHKNHELAIAMLAEVPGVALVLTGNGADLEDARGAALREHARRLGVAERVVALGMVSDGHYAALMRDATAVVIPTRGEGGGSFPVWEALKSGTPVACSDIPVLREWTQRMHADVPLLDPDDAAPWVGWLRGVLADPAAARARVAAVRAALTDRTWADVADAYLAMLDELA